MCHVLHSSEAWHKYECTSRHTHIWAMSHMRRLHVAHINETCRAYDFVMAYAYMSHVAHVNASSCTHTYVYIYSMNTYIISLIHIYVYLINTYIYISCTHAQAMSHTWMHVTVHAYINESCRTDKSSHFAHMISSRHTHLWFVCMCMCVCVCVLHMHNPSHIWGGYD